MGYDMTTDELKGKCLFNVILKSEVNYIAPSHLLFCGLYLGKQRPAMVAHTPGSFNAFSVSGA